MANATVIFLSVEHRVTATGQTDENGSCSLTTYASAGDGVVPGKHQATLIMQLPEGDADEVKVPVAIPARFSDPDLSGLEFTVTEDGPRQIAIDIPLK